jgi:thioredoxin-related protein
MRYKKTITLAMLVVTLLFLYYSLSAAPLVSDSEWTYISGLKWYQTFDEGQRVALEENKPILIYFWAIWCTWCEKLHTRVYPDPRIAPILNESFVRVAVDLDVNPEDARRFNVQFPPHLVFTTPQGEILTRIPGYIPADDLLPLLVELKERRAPPEEIHIEKELPQTRR